MDDRKKRKVREKEERKRVRKFNIAFLGVHSLSGGQLFLEFGIHRKYNLRETHWQGPVAKDVVGGDKTTPPHVH